MAFGHPWDGSQGLSLPAYVSIDYDKAALLGVWPLHGLCGAWGGIACGIFGSKALGGLGGVSLMSQVAGTLLGIGVAVAGGLIVYGSIKAISGIRLSEEEEFNGAELSIHQISATPERESGRRSAMA